MDVAIRCVRRERITYLQGKLKRIEAALHPDRFHTLKDPKQTRSQLSWLHHATTVELTKLEPVYYQKAELSRLRVDEKGKHHK